LAEVYLIINQHYIWHNGSLRGDLLLTTSLVVPAILFFLIRFWITGK